MKKAVKFTTLTLILLTLGTSIVYFIFGGMALKTLTSAGFVLAGLVNFIFCFKTGTDNKAFAIFAFSGLILSFLGDIVISITFITGAVIFALGHIFYIAAFCKAEGFIKRDLLFTCVLLGIALAVLMLYPDFNFDAAILAVCILYAVIISFMAGKAISNFVRRRSALNTVLAIGAVLFFISDAALLFYMFGGAGDIANTVCLFTYFPAQCVLAYGLHRNVN